MSTPGVSTLILAITSLLAACHRTTPVTPSEEPPRERAADASWVPSKTDARPAALDAGDDQPAAAAPDAGGVRSCEEALSDHEAEAKGAFTKGQQSAVLNRGSYLRDCGAPNTMEISICTAVLGGKVVGVTVRTEPEHPAMSRCIAERVRLLEFSHSASLDLTRTLFR